MKKSDLEMLARTLSPFLKAHASKITALEQRMAALEQQRSAEPGVKWAGVFRAGNGYDEGQLVTHAGGLWLARRATDTKPGGEAWTLICKRGAFSTGEE